MTLPMFSFSIDDLRAEDACDMHIRIPEIRAVRPDLRDDEPVPFSVWLDLPSAHALDAIWALRLDKANGRRASVIVAAKAARRVLHIFEAARPGDRRPRAAIEAAEAWLADPTDDNARAAADAATAADDADDAAVFCARAADDAAVFCARAADDAAYAAARAANAASAPNAAARAAARAAVHVAADVGINADDAADAIYAAVLADIREIYGMTL